ncbi:histidine ammonia-lyase [Myceligenerans pegani]|uniref:Histidine ammonia-lyase n=1 Tax=Myceligenerans pegani TaxID=2776917 RepID=A0ABR9N1N7_9MICO|nr:histidine ammonia-lyase [Myceligenerans sp. TRM 65318]MBE1877059.1 histidine ammonia-lyase [Myceligenerans sp. TRM 65318]MBE3019330.1 histidine ammonia-lyase [Myceligenerans sp. TRM 65318]
MTTSHASARPATPGSAPAIPLTVDLAGDPLTAAQVVAVARHGARVTLTDAARTRMAETRQIIDALADDPRPHYGVSTGFGALARTHIPAERRTDLQRSLVRSHAAGAGPEVEVEVVRALQLLRLNTLATGRTGVRPATAQVYADMLNAGITPVVREFGSLGCSGDLAPLSHVALAAMGEGEVRVVRPAGIEPTAATGAGAPEAAVAPGPTGPAGPGRATTAVSPGAARSEPPRPAAEALAEAGITPVTLAEKEGLALINGTDGMLGMLVLALHDLRNLLATADAAAALSVEALLGSDAPFAEDLVALRPHPGQAVSAANLRALLAGSGIMASHRATYDDGSPVCTRVQDAYSLRCAPQVHGAARDTLDHAAAVADRELAAAIDNPVVTPDGRVESCGNFHGAPVGYALDFVAVAVADVAGISERRTDRHLDKHRNDGLPPFLAHEAGVDSGLMIAQYTAAGIVSELKRLAVPASVDSIPSSAMQEDHVSMGWAAARKLRKAVDGFGRVLAIEIMAACRALDLRLAERAENEGGRPADVSAPPRPASPWGPDRIAPGTRAVYDVVRGAVGGPGADRVLAPEIDAVTNLVTRGAVVAAAAAAVGPLR